MIDTVTTILVVGAISSGMYALLAVGFSMIYGVTEITNLAHGTLFMLGAYMYLFLLNPFGDFKIHYLLALILSVFFVGILGGILYRLTMDPVVEDPVSIMVITLSLAMIIQEASGIVFGMGRILVPSIWVEFLKTLGMSDYLVILGVKTTYSQVLSAILSLGLFVALLIFIAKTKIGKAMKAMSQDREVAMLMGINIKRLTMLAMGMASTFAAVAGVLIISSTGGNVIYPHIWQTPLYIAFAIVILGGLGSIKGALVGAVIIGYVETIFVYGLDPIIAKLIGGTPGGTLASAVIMGFMLLILLFKPKGLFGKYIELED